MTPNMKTTSKNEDHLICEDNFQNKDNFKNEDILKNKDDINNEDKFHNKDFERCVTYNMKKIFTTPYLNSYNTTDLKPEIISAV